MKKLLMLIVAGVLMSGCIENNQQNLAHDIDQQAMESQQRLLQQTTPVPTLTESLEREILSKRLKLMNDHSKVFYIYLINYGKVMAFYTAQGKVSSLNSYMTPMEQIVRDDKCANDMSHSGNSGCYFAVDAPDQDGSYGMNDDGIFFFTTEGAYVEWHGDYMVSDQPLKLTQQPEMVMMVNEK